MANPLLPRIPTEGARLRQGGRVPTPARLAELSDAELNLLLRRFGIEQDRLDLLAQALARSAMRLVGAEAPSPALVESVFTRAENAVTRELRVAAKDLSRQYMAREMGVTGDTPERWQAVDGGRHSCPDCKDLHGEVRLHSEWLEAGLTPGSGNLICDGECRCQLVPDSAYEGPGRVRVTVGFQGQEGTAG